ncbi:uncharacterized protein LOC128406526 isoform X2 [Podarcis raffonei]|uniref:uncharacterized protein LOC128406526 isoform X2 n=1 Tax=Podarcis raffonei TaxID=65483 RepID=UPI0023296C12|nr:uncharacterized protein LOC128406526 isoform X2 [Podarcis raffonei]
MQPAWGQTMTKETMHSFSHTFLWFSIFIGPHLCQDSMEKQRLKQDLLIAVMCVFLVLLILLIVGCTVLHYKLMTDDITLRKEVKSFAIQTHCMETKFVLSPSPAEALESSQRMPCLPPCQALCLPPCQAPTSQGMSQPPCQPPSPPPSQPPTKPLTRQRSHPRSPPPAAHLPKPSKASPSKQKKAGSRSISHIYRSNSSESIHSDESGSIYSMEHFQCLYGSSRSGSVESLEGKGSQGEGSGGSNDSGSIMLCAIREM